MGEEKRRRLQQANAFRALDADFEKDGISTATLGFYDSDEFLAQERTNPRYLDNYGKWVMLRPRDDKYDARAKNVVPKLTELVAHALDSEKMQGSCVAASGMIARMLDRLGIWSFGVTGGLTLEVEAEHLWRGLATVDVPDFVNAALGHSWVIAPPYFVVDAAIALQYWGNDPIRKYIPDYYVGTSDGEKVKPQISDVVSAQVRARYAASGQNSSDLHYRLEPHLKEMGRSFPTLQYVRGPLSLRYVPVAIRQTDCPLEEINTASGVGRPAIDIWHEISPQLEALTASL